MKSASAGFQTLADDMSHVTLDATSFCTSSWPALLKLDVPEASSKGKIYRVLEPVQCVFCNDSKLKKHIEFIFGGPRGAIGSVKLNVRRFSKLWGVANEVLFDRFAELVISNPRRPEMDCLPRLPQTSYIPSPS